MQGVFESWIGQPAVLQVTLGWLKLSLRGKVLKESGETLLVRPQCGPDVEIAKTKVLAIEESAQTRRQSRCRPERLLVFKEQLLKQTEVWVHSLK